MLKRTITALFFLFVFFLAPSSVLAAYLSFDPTALPPINPGEEVKVKVMIDTEGEGVTQGHGFINYDPNVWEFANVTHTSFFPLVLYKNYPGQNAIVLVGTIEPYQPLVNGSGEIATISLIAKTGGTTSLTFHCIDNYKKETADGERDSDILGYDDSNPTDKFPDIIDCAKNQNAQFIVTGPTAGPGGTYNTPVPGTPTCDQCGFCQGGEKPDDWQQCMDCYNRPSHTWTVLGCIPNTASGLGQSVLSLVVAVAGGIAFLAFLYGAFLILTAKGDREQLEHGKDITVKSLAGLFIILFAVFILNFVGVEILRIPGFGG